VVSWFGDAWPLVSPAKLLGYQQDKDAARTRNVDNQPNRYPKQAAAQTKSTKSHPRSGQYRTNLPAKPFFLCFLLFQPLPYRLGIEEGTP
jgi:hypothetical protein